MRASHYKLEIIAYKKRSLKSWVYSLILLIVIVMSIFILERYDDDLKNLQFIPPLIILLSMVGIFVVLRPKKINNYGYIYFYPENIMIEKSGKTYTKEYTDIVKLRFKKYEGQPYFSGRDINYSHGEENFIWFGEVNKASKIRLKVEKRMLYYFIYELFEEKQKEIPEAMDWEFKKIH